MRATRRLGNNRSQTASLGLVAGRKVQRVVFAKHRVTRHNERYRLLLEVVGGQPKLRRLHRIRAVAYAPTAEHIVGVALCRNALGFSLVPHIGLRLCVLGVIVLGVVHNRNLMFGLSLRLVEVQD